MSNHGYVFELVERLLFVASYSFAGNVISQDLTCLTERERLSTEL